MTRISSKNYVLFLLLIGFSLLIAQSCKKETASTTNNSNPVDTTTNPIDTTNNPNPNPNPTNDSVYVKFSIMSDSYEYYTGLDSIRTELYGSSRLTVDAYDGYSWGNADNSVTFTFYTDNLAVGSTPELQELLSLPLLPPVSYWIYTPTYINITEVGPNGGYISGNFAGKVLSRYEPPPNDTIRFSGRFRIPKRF